MLSTWASDSSWWWYYEGLIEQNWVSGISVPILSWREHKELFMSDISSELRYDGVWLLRCSPVTGAGEGLPCENTLNLLTWENSTVAIQAVINLLHMKHVCCWVSSCPTLHHGNVWLWKINQFKALDKRNCVFSPPPVAAVLLHKLHFNMQWRWSWLLRCAWQEVCCGHTVDLSDLDIMLTVHRWLRGI